MGFFDMFKKKKNVKEISTAEHITTCSDIIQVIKALPKMLSLNPITEEQIVDAENQLGLKFSREYREYVAEFGFISAQGIELTGICKAEHVNVISLTQQEWDLNPHVPHNMYVIENTCIDGIIVWQDEKGVVYQTQYDNQPKKIAISLANYILNKTKQ